MKKHFLLFYLFSFIFSLSEAHAYTSTDVSNASFLATEGIIVQQSSASGYRLDDTITRAEVVGIALKLKGVPLPSYRCKGYYADTRLNDWICRAVEIAADNGLVSRANAWFRPQDRITRAEALAIIARDIEDLPNSYDDPTNYIDANIWQIEVIKKAIARGIISPEIVFGKDMDGMYAGFKEKNVYFYPNRAATRAEVFGFARNILNSGNVCELEGIKVDGSCEIASGAMTEKMIKFGDIVTNDMSGYVGPECSIAYHSGFIQDDTTFFGSSSYTQINTRGGKIDAIGTMYAGPGHLILGQKGYYILGGTTDKCAPNITLSDARKVTNIDVLMLYYKNIRQGSVELAYPMRSPAGVSLETFESWYKNTTSIIFREDTVKSLGDNTYEFLIDMTENGVKSTFKVKSKVDLLNFKINNLSSVKQ